MIVTILGKTTSMTFQTMQYNVIFQKKFAMIYLSWSYNINMEYKKPYEIILYIYIVKILLF